MITEDEATRLLKRADPALFYAVAPAVDAAGYLAALRTRSTTVTLIDTESKSGTGGRNRWPIIALAAAALVAVVVGVLILAAREDSEPPVPANTTLAPDTVVPDTAASAEEVARAFLDAYVARDADRALAYLTDEAIEKHWGTSEVFRWELLSNEALGFKVMIQDCQPTGDDAEAGITLRCPFDYHWFGSDETGLGPFGDNHWDFTVRAGQIVSAPSEVEVVTNASGIFLWEEFADWISTAHPDDVLVMYTDSNQELVQVTEEALRLWEQRIQDFVQAVLTGREDYSANVARICATQNEQLAELAAPAEGSLDQAASWSTAAAAIMQQAHRELTALAKPPATDTVAYSDYYGQLIRLVRNLEDSAEAATAADSTLVDELEAEYVDIRAGVSSGPAGSGLETCLASLPS